MAKSAPPSQCGFAEAAAKIIQTDDDKSGPSRVTSWNAHTQFPRFGALGGIDERRIYRYSECWVRNGLSSARWKWRLQPTRRRQHFFSSGGTLPNWTVASNSVNTAAGGFAPSAGGNNWTSTWWSGSNIGYLQSTANGATVSLSQVLGDNLLNDTTYTLSALIGNRTFGAGLNYSMQLFAGSTLLASSSALNLSDNTFGSDSLVFNSGANNPLAGQALMVRFSTTGSGSFLEAFFDNVALDAVTANNGGGANNPVPEPSSIALTMLGGLGLLAARAHRKG